MQRRFSGTEPGEEGRAIAVPSPCKRRCTKALGSESATCWFLIGGGVAIRQIRSKRRAKGDCVQASAPGASAPAAEAHSQADCSLEEHAEFVVGHRRHREQATSRSVHGPQSTTRTSTYRQEARATTYRRRACSPRTVSVSRA